jgi:DNA-binding CsgD family transcriptional regulator
MPIKNSRSLLPQSKELLESCFRNSNIHFKKNNTRFYIGDSYQGIYFTKQEAYCMICFLQGCTTQETADYLKLSKGSVFYYLANMKNKLNCSSKNQLVLIVQKTNFGCFVGNILKPTLI